MVFFQKGWADSLTQRQLKSPGRDQQLSSSPEFPPSAESKLNLLSLLVPHPSSYFSLSFPTHTVGSFKLSFLPHNIFARGIRALPRTLNVRACYK